MPNDRDWLYPGEQGGGYGFDYRPVREVLRFAPTREQNLAREAEERYRATLPYTPTPKPEPLNGDDPFRPCGYCRHCFLTTFVKCMHTVCITKDDKLILQYPDRTSETFSLDGSDIQKLRAALKKHGLYGETSTLNLVSDQDNHLRGVYTHSSDRKDNTTGNLLYKAKLGLREDIFGVCALIWHRSGDKRVLTVDRPRNQYDHYKLYADINLPGGKVEKYENADDAIIRECLEETGIVVKPEDLEVVYEGPDKDGDYPNGIARTYLVKKYTGRIRTREKGHNVKWLPIKAMIDYRNHSFEQYNRRLFKHLGEKV